MTSRDLGLEDEFPVAVVDMAVDFLLDGALELISIILLVCLTPRRDYLSLAVTDIA